MNVVKQLRQDSVRLSDVVPLETPFTFNIIPNNYCDFKCAYCQQSLPKEEAEKVLGRKTNMSFETFKNAVDGMNNFKSKFKVFNFCGTGETILTPDLPQMIAYAKEKNVAERLNIVTNGYSLTKEKSNALINAGLDSLRISIQGLDAKQYKQMSNVDVDFDKLVQQIKYFYDNRRDCQVHIKIIDIALKQYTEQDFYNMFGDISTSIAVEYFIPNQQIASAKVNMRDRDITVHGKEKKEVKVCFSAFYALTLFMNGEVAPCCIANPPIFLGNVNEMSVYNMWNSPKYRNFIKAQLKDRSKIKGCNECIRPQNALQEGDNLDDYADDILKKITDLEEGN